MVKEPAGRERVTWSVRWRGEERVMEGSAVHGKAARSVRWCGKERVTA